MGAPKQKWNPEEEAALKAGVLKHGPGKWRTILKDPQFNAVLYLRSNVDLKDKWRNMSVMANGWGSRERAKLALATTRSGPRYKAYGNGSQSDEEMADGKTNTASGSSSPNDGSSRSIMRLDNLIVEAINNLREPGGSTRASVSAYIEDQYWAPSNFKRILSSKLKHMAAMGKLDKMNRKYRIRTAPSLPEKRQNPTVPAQEGRQRINSGDINNPLETEVDLELARMRSMTPQEASAAAAQAVAEAEAAIAEAEEAEREAEAAEAEAEAAEAFAEATRKTMEGRNGPSTNKQMILV